MKQLLVVFMSCVVMFVYAQEQKCDFDSESAVRAHFKPSRNAPIVNWLKGSTARGSTFKSIVSIETRWHDADTHDYLYSDFFQSMYTISRQGTVVAVPVSDWQEHEAFTYRQFNGKIAAGKLVTVTMQLCIPNISKPPTERVCEGVVKNIAESGLSIPDCVGTPGHVQAIKKSARERFGASSAEVIYRGLDGTDLKFLLFNCVEKKAKKNIGPIVFDGKRGGANKPKHKDHGDPLESGKDREPAFHKAVRKQIEDQQDDVIIW